MPAVEGAIFEQLKPGMSPSQCARIPLSCLFMLSPILANMRNWGEDPDFIPEHYMVFHSSNFRSVTFTKRIGQLSGSARTHWGCPCWPCAARPAESCHPAQVCTRNPCTWRKQAGRPDSAHSTVLPTAAVLRRSASATLTAGETFALGAIGRFVSTLMTYPFNRCVPAPAPGSQQQHSNHVRGRVVRQVGGRAGR